MSNKQKHLSRDWDPKSGPRFWREMGSSLGRYTPKYFILFVAMVNDIVSLISLSVSHCQCIGVKGISVC